MQDRELVAAVAAGDPEGFAEAYDRYAATLYTYCRFMLPDPDPLDGAAQVVQDTFIIASSRLQGLRDPDRLGSWLQAVARNECLRRLGAGESQGAARFSARADPVDALPAVELPEGLREQVLKVCADSTPTGRAHRVSVTHRAGPFDRTGYPEPIIPPGPAWWHEVRRHPRAAAAVAVIAGAVLAAGITALAVAGGSHRAQASTVALGGGVSPVASSTAPGSASAPASPGHRTAAAKGTPTPSVLADAPTSQGATPGTPQPSAPAASSSSGSPSTSPSPSPSPSSSQAQGYLVAAPTKLVLSAVKGKAAIGTFTLTAAGGPVSTYAISSASSKVTVSPSHGTLRAAGARVVITVTVNSLVALDTKIIVKPGYLVITVVFSIKL
jgi:hypothetical protein